jgi:hypothetical protein
MSSAARRAPLDGLDELLARIDHWGRYIDSYRTIDGKWRFAHRKVTVDDRADGSVL